jgi:ABC-2 type transport system ATP-binding protein
VSDLAIQTTGLSRHFGAVRAVDGLDLAVPAGIIFGFLGPNGAGKTTTIRLLLGLLEPTAGRATVLGHDSRAQASAIRDRCGALLEYSGLYGRLSARQNLDFYGRIWHMPAAERAARIQALLAHFGLWERRDEAAESWSRGMRQKLALARTLLHRPRLIFLDEPTAGLDPVAAASLRDDLSALASQEGVTVFLNTHNLAEAERLCRLIGVIRAGRLIAFGSPAELKARQSGHQVIIIGRGFDDQVAATLRDQPGVHSLALQDGRFDITLAPGADTAPLVSAVVAAGGAVEEVRRGAASLEETFLTLLREEESS